MSLHGGSSDAEVVEILKESHKTMTGEYPRSVGDLPTYCFCGNDIAHLERADMECCLYGLRGYKYEAEEHVRIDEMVTCSKFLALTGVEVCTSTGR